MIVKYTEEMTVVSGQSKASNFISFPFKASVLYGIEKFWKYELLVWMFPTYNALNAGAPV